MNVPPILWERAFEALGILALCWLIALALVSGVGAWRKRPRYLSAEAVRRRIYHDEHEIGGIG